MSAIPGKSPSVVPTNIAEQRPIEAKQPSTLRSRSKSFLQRLGDSVNHFNSDSLRTGSQIAPSPLATRNAISTPVSASLVNVSAKGILLAGENPPADLAPSIAAPELAVDPVPAALKQLFISIANNNTQVHELLIAGCNLNKHTTVDKLFELLRKEILNPKVTETQLHHVLKFALNFVQKGYSIPSNEVQKQNLIDNIQSLIAAARSRSEYNSETGILCLHLSIAIKEMPAPKDPRKLMAQLQDVESKDGLKDRELRAMIALMREAEKSLDPMVRTKAAELQQTLTRMYPYNIGERTAKELYNDLKAYTAADFLRISARDLETETKTSTWGEFNLHNSEVEAVLVDHVLKSKNKEKAKKEILKLVDVAIKAYKHRDYQVLRNLILTLNNDFIKNIMRDTEIYTDDFKAKRNKWEDVLDHENYKDDELKHLKGQVPLTSDIFRAVPLLKGGGIEPINKEGQINLEGGPQSIKKYKEALTLFQNNVKSEPDNPRFELLVRNFEVQRILRGNDRTILDSVIPGDGGSYQFYILANTYVTEKEFEVAYERLKSS